MKKLLFIFALFLIVFITACGGGTTLNEAAERSEPFESVSESTAVPPEPTAEPTESPFPADISDQADLVGLWDGNFGGSHGYMMFADDGTYFLSLNQETILDEPLVIGEYSLEEGQLHLRDLENAGHWTECAKEGVYGTAVSDSGTLTFVTIEDNCNEGGFNRNFLMGNTKWTYLGEGPS